MTGADAGVGLNVRPTASASPPRTASASRRGWRIAADGRNSVLREAAGIGTNAWSYDQTALATSFDHTGPHDGISTEYHKAAGPFTTVPMPGNRSSLVWMERPARAAELMALSDAELAAEIQIGTHGELGLRLRHRRRASCFRCRAWWRATLPAIASC